MKSFHSQTSDARLYADALERSPVIAPDTSEDHIRTWGGPHHACWGRHMGPGSDMNHMRRAKGALAAALATAVCHTVMSLGYAEARGGADRDPGAEFAGTTGFILTSLASWILMPVLLWAGMRLVRETSNHLLVISGAVIWFALSGYFMDNIDQEGGHMPFLALSAYLLIAALLAGWKSGTVND